MLDSIHRACGRGPAIRLQQTCPRKSRTTESQVAAIHGAKEIHWLVVPNAAIEWAPGRAWGHFDACYSAAFWALHAWQHRLQYAATSRHALGENLREEVAACLLGGHGMPAEVGLAAFARVRDAQMLSHPAPSSEHLERLLRLPLSVNGREVKYRFPVVKARQLSRAMSTLHAHTPPTSSAALRDWLQTIPGIGPKTASWIVRNRDANARVAILDIHVIRACQILGMFPHRLQLPRDYNALEASFIRFADQLGLPPGDVDAAMWYEMRVAPAMVADALRKTPTVSTVRERATPLQ